MNIYIHVINVHASTVHMLKFISMFVFRCPVGHYCPAGSQQPIRCENGTYQDEEYQWQCKDCPPGIIKSFVLLQFCGPFIVIFTSIYCCAKTGGAHVGLVCGRGAQVSWSLTLI